jgi:hypothetical protein
MVENVVGLLSGVEEWASMYKPYFLYDDLNSSSSYKLSDQVLTTFMPTELVSHQYS